MLLPLRIFRSRIAPHPPDDLKKNHFILVNSFFLCYIIADSKKHLFYKARGSERMKLDFVKNTKRNVIAKTIHQVFQLLFPFLNRTLFLWLLGPEYLGLNGLFASVLGVLRLAELGFGSAVGCSMFKLVARDDREQICAALKLFRTLYHGVGIVIFGVGLCLLPFIRQIIHGDVPPGINIYILYLIHLINTSVGYFFFAYRGSILTIHYRDDILTNISTSISVLQYITVALILFFTRSYYYYVIATVVFSILYNLMILLATKRLFPDIEPRGKTTRALKHRILMDSKSVFMHKIGGTVLSSGDNIVISSFLGLTAIAVYGNYNFIRLTVAGFVGVVAKTIRGGIGNRIHTETRDNVFLLFMKLHKLSMIGTVWSMAMMIALYQPFMRIWIKDDPALMRHLLTPLLMAICFFVLQARQMLQVFKEAADIWHQDRWKPLCSAFLNLGLNILFVVVFPENYKLDGVILSTILAILFIDVPWETYIMFSLFFNAEQARDYLKLQTRFLFIAVVLSTATWYGANVIPIEGLPGLVVKGIVAAIISGSMTLAIFHSDIKVLIASVFKKDKKALTQ